VFSSLQPIGPRDLFLDNVKTTRYGCDRKIDEDGLTENLQGTGETAVDVSRPEDGELRSRLREAGLRATQQRMLVYGALRRDGGHRSVDEIVTLLRESGHRIPRMSVYNVVTDLESAGLLMCADTGPGRALYEAGDTWHHHFVCRVCKAVVDVPCVRGKKPCLKPPSLIRGTVEEAQVIFRGVCEACAKAEQGVVG
jgi:Fur family ferric uptake transcriptional regulator